MNDNPTVLLMFSGGLDSLGALYLLLTDKQYSNFNIHVHHLHLSNSEQRHYVEKTAVDVIIKYLRDKKYRDFTYTESLHYFPSIPNSNGRLPFDSDIVLFMASMICMCDKTITHYASGITASDLMQGIVNPHVEITRRLFEQLTYSEGHGVKRIYPVDKFTKDQIRMFLPIELSSLAWSCRTPIYKDEEPEVCGRCQPCIIMRGILNA